MGKWWTGTGEEEGMGVEVRGGGQVEEDERSGRGQVRGDVRIGGRR